MSEPKPEWLERLILLEKAIGFPDFAHLPVISDDNRGQFQADLREVLAALDAANERAVKAEEKNEAALKRMRARGSADVIMQRMANIRAQIAGMRPGDAEFIALIEERVLFAEDEAATLRAQLARTLPLVEAARAYRDIHAELVRVEAAGVADDYSTLLSRDDNAEIALFRAAEALSREGES